MNFKRILILSLVILTNAALVAQSDAVCASPSSSDDLLMELNILDKCVHEKMSVDNTVPQVRKKRYLRARKSSYYRKLRKNLRTIGEAKIVTPKKEVREVYLGEVTQEPVLLASDGNYKGDLKEVLDNYVKANLKTSEVLKKTNGGIVWTSFVIDANGNVKNIVALGPINGKLLEAEATRVIQSLPKFNPGKLDAESVSVKHLIVINFEADKPL